MFHLPAPSVVCGDNPAVRSFCSSIGLPNQHDHKTLPEYLIKLSAFPELVNPAASSPPGSFLNPAIISSVVRMTSFETHPSKSTSINQKNYLI